MGHTKRNIKDLLERLKQTLEEYSRELLRAVEVKNSIGKSRASRIRRQQIVSRISYLTNEVKSSIFSGNILQVTYMQEVNGKPHKKYEALLTDISKADFEYFLQTMNSTRKNNKLVILEIQEIPTFIREVPL